MRERTRRYCTACGVGPRCRLKRRFADGGATQIQPPPPNVLKVKFVTKFNGIRFKNSHLKSGFNLFQSLGSTFIYMYNIYFLSREILRFEAEVNFLINDADIPHFNRLIFCRFGNSGGARKIIAMSERDDEMPRNPLQPSDESASLRPEGWQRERQVAVTSGNHE